MTDHAEISRRLALAIGWPESETWPATETSGDFLVRTARLSGYDHWRIFDYRDPLVIWPIAERHDCFPFRGSGGRWAASTGSRVYFGDTAAEAVALAVIGGAR